MFTKQTISALSSLLELSYKVEDLARQTNAPHCTETRDTLLCTDTSQDLAEAGRTAMELVSAAVIEGLRQARPSFADTPFAGQIEGIISSYEKGSASDNCSASVELNKLIRTGGDWLKEQEEATLPQHKYTVGSAYGDYEVMATSPAKARVTVAAQHFKCKPAELDGDHMRAFANGVLA